MQCQLDGRSFAGLLWWCLILALCRVPQVAAQEPKLRTTLECDSQVHCLAISPDGRTLAAGVSDGTIRLWDLATGKPSATLKEGEWPVIALAFGKKGKTLAQGTGVALGGKPNDYLILWDVPKQKKVRTFLAVKAGTTGIGSVNSLVFSKDGTTLLAATVGGIFVWDVTKDEKPRFLTAKEYDGVFVSVAISPDGKTVVAAHGMKDSLDGEPAVIVWDLLSGKKTATFKELKGNRFAVAFSPDGKTVATTGSEGIPVHLLDLASGKTTPLKGAKKATTCSVVFSPDGKTVAAGTGSPDDEREQFEVVLWNVERGKAIATLQGHKGPVISVVFNPDGTILATAGDDPRRKGGMIRLWEINPEKKPPR